MKPEEFRVYQISMDLGDDVWDVVIKWDFFAKDTIGKQLVRAIDSVAANLSEGYGRYHYKEAKNFSYYSRGSLYETKTWLTKAKNRKLLNEEIFNQMMITIDDISVKLNNYIKSIGKTKNQWPLPHARRANDHE